MHYSVAFLIAISACELLTSSVAAPIANTDSAEKAKVKVDENKVKPDKLAKNKAESSNTDGDAKIVKMLEGMKSRMIPVAEKTALYKGSASPGRLRLVPGGSGFPGDKQGKAVLQRLDSIKQTAGRMDTSSSNQEPTNFDLSQALDPQNVAEYLIVTGDFGTFDDAIENLMKTHLLDPKDITEYAESVSQEYEDLLKALLERQEEEAEAEDAVRNADTPDLDTLFELVSLLPAEEQAAMLVKANEYARQQQTEIGRYSAENESDEGETESNELRQLTESKELEHSSDDVKRSAQHEQVAESKQTETREKNEDLSKKSTQ